MQDRPPPATLRQYHRHNLHEGKPFACPCVWCDLFRKQFGGHYDPDDDPDIVIPEQREPADRLAPQAAK